MNGTDMKNMVILKNLPSNIVEEAFVILKENKKIKKPEYIDINIDAASEGFKSRKIGNGSSKNYIVKEAEMLISKYISDVEEKILRKRNEQIIVKYKKMKIATIFLGIVLVLDVITKLVG